MQAPSTAGSFAASSPTQISLRTDDGVELDARHWAQPDGARTTVVIAHGFTGDQAMPGLLDIADGLWATGNALVTFDSRGHGASGGQCTLGASEPLDVRAAVQFAQTQTPETVVVGASLGALAALRYASGDSSLAGLILVSCPATWRLRTPQAALTAAITRTSLGRRAVAKLQHVRIAAEWDIGEAPVSTAPLVQCPVAVIHGRRDLLIPASEARRLYDAVHEPRRLDVVPRMGHAFQPQLREPLLAALAWTRRFAT